MAHQQLIIGFGTGRSGSTSLSAFFSMHERVRILHEGRWHEGEPAHPFAWTGDEEQILHWLGDLLKASGSYRWVGDIGMYYINYVDKILQHYPNTRFICMQRPQEEVVQSYLEWTIGQNRWMEHDGTQWKHDDRWDKAFPKFEAEDKEDALRMYCRAYAQQVQALQTRLPEQVMVVELTDFNTPECRNAILDFIGFIGPRDLTTPVMKNTIKGRREAKKRRALTHRLLQWKRAFFGKPGDRWFRRQKQH